LNNASPARAASLPTTAALAPLKANEEGAGTIDVEDDWVLVALEGAGTMHGFSRISLTYPRSEHFKHL